LRYKYTVIFRVLTAVETRKITISHTTKQHIQEDENFQKIDFYIV